LRASGVAILLVTHRAPSCDFVQRVFRLEHGCLTEESIKELSLLEAEAVAVAL
jgi:ABC-type transport system involved in cytochrome bd biosynthesis fused ATPase/permease subunit